MLIRNMYQEEDHFEVLDYLIDNTTGDPDADAKIVELEPETIFGEGIVLLTQDLNITIPEAGNRVDIMAAEIIDSVPTYLKTKEREELAYYLAREILELGLANGRTVKLFQNGIAQDAATVVEEPETSEEELEEEEEEIQPAPKNNAQPEAEFGF